MDEHERARLTAELEALRSAEMALLTGTAEITVTHGQKSSTFSRPRLEDLRRAILQREFALGLRQGRAVVARS